MGKCYRAVSLSSFAVGLVLIAFDGAMSAPVRYAIDLTTIDDSRNPGRLYTITGTIVVDGEGVINQDGVSNLGGAGSPLITGYDISVTPQGSGIGHWYLARPSSFVFSDIRITDLIAGETLHAPSIDGSSTAGSLVIEDFIGSRECSPCGGILTLGSFGAGNDWITSYFVIDPNNPNNGVIANDFTPQSEDFVVGTRIREGDYDGDGLVTMSDYDMWVLQFGRGPQGGIDAADGNGDFLVDAADYTIWRDAYSAANRLSSVPEPSTGFLLFAASILAMMRTQQLSRPV